MHSPYNGGNAEPTKEVVVAPRSGSHRLDRRQTPNEGNSHCKRELNINIKFWRRVIASALLFLRPGVDTSEPCYGILRWTVLESATSRNSHQNILVGYELYNQLTVLEDDAITIWLLEEISIFCY